MTYTPTHYRQFGHDMLNIIARIQSVTELADIQDKTLKQMLEQDLQSLTRTVELFTKLGGCAPQDSAPENATPLDASALVFEVVAADRPEKALLAIDENIRIETDQALFRAIVAELVRNMAAHAAPEASAKIKLYKSFKGHVLELTNQSQHPLPEQPHGLFIRGPESKGLGLGLAFITHAAAHLKMPFNIEAEGQNIKASLVIKAA